MRRRGNQKWEKKKGPLFEGKRTRDVSKGHHNIAKNDYTPKRKLKGSGAREGRERTKVESLKRGRREAVSHIKKEVSLKRARLQRGE